MKKPMLILASVAVLALAVLNFWQWGAGGGRGRERPALAAASASESDPPEHATITPGRPYAARLARWRRTAVRMAATAG